MERWLQNVSCSVEPSRIVSGDEMLKVQPDVERGSCGAEYSPDTRLMLPPIATQRINSRLVIPDAKADLAEAQGTYIPRLNNPRTGPPKTPKIPSQA